MLVLGAALRVGVAARARKGARGSCFCCCCRRRRCRFAAAAALFAVRAAARDSVDAVTGADVSRRVGDEPDLEREREREREFFVVSKRKKRGEFCFVSSLGPSLKRQNAKNQNQYSQSRLGVVALCRRGRKRVGVVLEARELAVVGDEKEEKEKEVEFFFLSAHLVFFRKQSFLLSDLFMLSHSLDSFIPITETTYRDSCLCRLASTARSDEQKSAATRRKKARRDGTPRLCEAPPIEILVLFFTARFSKARRDAQRGKGARCRAHVDVRTRARKRKGES